MTAQLNIRNDHWVYPVYCLWFTENDKSGVVEQ